MVNDIVNAALRFTGLSQHLLPLIYDCRLSLRSEWRGLRNEELSEVSGIPDCVFVHISGFIGGNKTYEGALQMARLSLNQT